MANILTHLCVILLVVAPLYGSVTRAALAQSSDTCMQNRAVQALIASHQIKTWPAIKAIAGISDKYKEVSAVRLCQEGGTPYYVVNVAGPSGESRQLVLNAVDGSQ